MTPLHVAVVGAGAFGGWTALHLLRRGARVTLLDAWGAGNSRSSSGGETRIIRGVYGPDRLYVDWTARSFGLWKEAEQRWGTRFYHRTGVLWMAGEDDSYVRASLPFLKDAGLAIEEIAPRRPGSGFPQIDFAGVRTVFFEPEAGYLLARRACRAVAEAVAAEGGEVRLAAGFPDAFQGGALKGLELTDGSTLRADLYLFACGPWLGGLFPEVIGDLLRVTRQEVFFFGLPPGDPWFHEERCPTWVDLSGERIYYGMPGNENRGFKVADDTRGAPFDPTFEERLVTPGPAGGGARGHGPPLSGHGGRAGRRDPRLPVREQPGRPPPLRPPPASRQRLAPRRRLRPRLQARPRPRRIRRPYPARRRHPRSALPSRPPRPRGRSDPDAVRALKAPRSAA